MKSNIYTKNTSFFSTLICLFFPLVFVSVSLSAEILSVKGEKVNLREGPGIKYNIKYEYNKGFPFEVIERKKEWVKVKDFENDTGWMHKSVLSKRRYTIVKANRNKDKSINIRNGPGSDNQIIGKAYYGVVLKILEHESGWVKVQHQSGLTGWISSNLLWGH